MPRATVSRDSTEKIMLKTCPDAFIVLRRMSYGEFLKRQEMSMKMTMKSGQQGKDSDLDLSMLQRQVQEFEFKSCIVDHNLEDDGGQPLDFTKSHTLDILDPRIGQEIDKNISALIKFEDDLKN